VSASRALRSLYSSLDSQRVRLDFDWDLVVEEVEEGGFGSGLGGGGGATGRKGWLLRWVGIRSSRGLKSWSMCSWKMLWWMWVVRLGFCEAEGVESLLLDVEWEEDIPTYFFWGVSLVWFGLNGHWLEVLCVDSRSCWRKGDGKRGELWIYTDDPMD